MGYFRKKTNMRGVGGGGWKPPCNFLFFYFTPGNSKQNKPPVLEIQQNSVTSLGNSKSKNQDPWKFHMIPYPQSSNSIFQIPYPQPPSPYLIFFSGIAQCHL